jgi:hypothetical protein
VIRAYFVRIWDADAASVKFEVRCFARHLAQNVDEAEHRIPAMLALRSMEGHVMYVVVASERATREAAE